ncbi:MAG: alpha/beta hydrolase [Sneathiellaceae bacterium]
MKPLYRQFQTQAELDAAYDVEAAVPDFMAHARHFGDQSALARHRLKTRSDIPYGATLAEHLDIFPAAATGAPVVLFLHGGYWRMLSSKDFSCVALGIVPAGFCLVNVNYALCPAVTLDEIVRQARAALAWTWRNIANHGGDPRRIVLAGHSAGAQLAAMCLAADWPGEYGLPADIAKGALLLSGLYDLRPLPYSFVQPALQLTSDQVQRNSPALAPPRCDTPVTIAWGAAEPPEFRRQSADFLEAWRRAGNEGRALTLPEADHFTALYGLEEPGGALCGALRTLAGRT